MPLTKLTAFTDYVGELADKPNATMSAAQVKAYFDAAPDEVRQYLNGLIDDLLSTTDADSGADNIGATPIGTSPSTVQGILEWLKTQIDTTVLGQIPDGTLTDAKLSNAETEIKQRFATHKADDVKHLNYATASGTNAYSVDIVDIETLVEGLSIKVKFTNANTAAATLNINGLGDISIKKGNGNDLASGNIKVGQICHLVYSGTFFQLLGEGGEYGTATASDVLENKTVGTESGIVQGTMPNRGTFNLGLGASVPAGYYSGGTVPSKFTLNSEVTQIVSNDSIRHLAKVTSEFLFFLMREGGASYGGHGIQKYNKAGTQLESRNIVSAGSENVKGCNGDYYVVNSTRYLWNGTLSDSSFAITGSYKANTYFEKIGADIWELKSGNSYNSAGLYKNSTLIGTNMGDQRDYGRSSNFSNENGTWISARGVKVKADKTGLEHMNTDLALFL